MTNSVYPWQSKQWSQLFLAHDSNRLAHALLLVGQAGLGIEQFAYTFASKLLCRKPASNLACGQCKSCTLAKAGNHPDIMRIVPEGQGKQIRVDDIRELISSIQLCSASGLYKIAIVDPADAMNKSSANALLKILEEPPGNTIFFLISSRPAYIPITIRSRCNRVNFTKTFDEDAISWLMERTNLDHDKAEELLVIAQGQPILAEELSSSDIMTNWDSILEDLSSLIQEKIDVIKLAKKWQDYGAADVLQWMLAGFNTMVRLKLAIETDQNSNIVFNRHLQHLADVLDLRQIVGCYDMVFRNYKAMNGQYNLNKQGLLEEVIVYCQSTCNPSERVLEKCAK